MDFGLTNEEALVSGAILGGFAAMVVAFVIIWYLLYILAYWNVFTKADEKGWKAIIPFYNTYTMFKICWNVKMFWIFLAFFLISGILSGFGGAIDVGALVVIGDLIVIPAAIISIMANYKLSKAFGHGIPFTVGLVILNVIFMLILGFGKAKYIGNTTKEQAA